MENKRFDKRFFDRSLESWVGIKIDELIDFLSPKCQKILTQDKLIWKLKNQSKLKIKFGIDPTASDVHLGHIVPIMLLQQFARAGHHIDFIIGDFTARVGDPTARDIGRIPLTPEKIKENMSTYKNQIGRYLDLSVLCIHNNTQWLNIMTLQEVFDIFQQVNLSEAMQREDFKARIRNQQAVSLAEVCYGVLMGIDSVHLKTDVEIGGIDQLLNFQQCRKIMHQSDMEEEVILMTPILEGTSGDGRKMSKSYNNYITVNSTIEDKFGKIMSIPDRLIRQYFCCFADVHKQELGELDKFISSNPLEAKKQLATIIISLESKDIEDGFRERESFERKFSRKEIQKKDCIELFESADVTLFDALVKSGCFKSKSELHRLFKQLAVRSVNEDTKKILHPNILVSQIKGFVRVGKKFFFQLKTF